MELLPDSEGTSMQRETRGSQPLLTIAVPTYNRSACLELGLNRLREELETLDPSWRSLVKVIVSNNASTDDTMDILNRNPCVASGEFEVVTNAENIGGERNVAQCYAGATTPYVWVIGDDDLILPQGLGKVLKVLLENDVDLMYVNNYWFENDYERKPTGGERTGISILSDATKFARRANVLLTFVSAMIVRRREECLCEASVAEGSNLPQLGWILPAMRDGSCFAVIEDWVVAAKGGNSGGYDLVEVFGTNLTNVTGKIFGGEAEILKIIQNGTIINFFPGFVLALRGGESAFLAHDVENGLGTQFGDNWRYYVFLLPLIKLPLIVARRYNQILNMMRRWLGDWLI